MSVYDIFTQHISASLQVLFHALLLIYWPSWFNFAAQTKSVSGSTFPLSTIFRQTGQLTNYHLTWGSTTWVFWDRADKLCVPLYNRKPLSVEKWLELLELKSPSFSGLNVFRLCWSRFKLIVCVAVWIVENFNCYHDEFIIGQSQHFSFGLLQQYYQTKPIAFTWFFLWSSWF